MIDACGMAGGRYPGQGHGGAGADYMNTTLSKQAGGGEWGGGRSRGVKVGIGMGKELSFKPYARPG